MFVPVDCSHCAKPFQVPDAALGQQTLCPWCQQVVRALPVGAPTEAPVAPVPAPKPEPAPAAAPEPAPKPARAIPVTKPLAPLSLDDDEPAKPAAPGPKARGLLSPVAVVAGVGLSLAVMALTVAALGYGSGRVPEALWTEFTPPDGSCAVLLPGAPTEEDVEPNPAGSATGGKRYVARGWYTRSSAWLAWNELEPSFAAVVPKDKDKALTAAAVKAELEREKARLQGTVTKEAEVRFNFAWGVEVHMDTPRGKVVEWLLVTTDGPRPRLYVYGLQGTNITHDSAVVRRMFTSFKLKE